MSGTVKTSGNVKTSGIVKSIGIVMILTVLSRLFALGSNQFYLITLSINEYMDAFTYAMGLPNIIFAGLGTALTTVVVPIFAGHMHRNDKRRAFAFISNITTLAIIVTFIIAFLGIFIAPILASVKEFRDIEALKFAVFAIRFTFPIMIFYAITYIFQGVLQSCGRFIAPSIVSLPGSIIVILYVFFLGGRFGVLGLLVATIVGLTFQVIVMIPSVYKTGFNFKPMLNLKDDDLKMSLKLIPPVFVGAAAWQVNMIYNLTLAYNFKDGATLVSLVQNIITSGILTLVYSVTAVIYPKFTLYLTNGDMDGFKGLFVKSISSTMFFVVPLAFGFIILSKELLNLVYGWGKITPANVEMAGLIMTFYSFGIVGHSIKEIADKAFYSLKNTKKPAINGFFIMVVNVLASLLFIRIIGVYGIPLAYTISLTAGAIMILVMLKTHIGNFGGKILAINISKILFSGGGMILGILFVKKISYNISLGSVFAERLVLLLLPAIIGIIIYFVIALILKLNDADTIYKRLRRFTKVN